MQDQQVVIRDEVIPVLIGRSFERPVLAVAPQSTAYVSRHHVELVAEGGELWCTDLGSANGTWINRGSETIRANPHERVRVKVGDVLTTIDQTVLCEITQTAQGHPAIADTHDRVQPSIDKRAG